MCGIALIVSGIRIDLSSVVPDFTPPTPQSEQLLLCVDDIEAALWRRGPDSLGRQKVFLCSKLSSSALERDILCLIEGEGDTQRGLHHYTETFDCISSANGVPSEIVNDYYISKSVSELHFIGATLQLRGISPITQPLADTHGNILVYNGEIFGGIHVSSDSNDTEILMQSLAQCCLCNSHQHTRTCKSSGKGQNSVPELLSMIKGPWALIYWQGSSRTVWFGRDALGRRSLLVHWPTSEDSRLLLSSVSSPSSRDTSSGPMQGSILLPSQRVLIALRESVIRRTTLNTIFEAVTSDNRQDGRVPVAVLFSGGLDSMILAALLNECLDPIYEIDLLNVSFDGQSAPDRISARAGVKELKRIAPLRRWKLVEIDAELSKLPLETKHVMSLINPAKTYMDLNIGIALWLAAGGDGWVYEGIGSDGYEECQRVQYKSESKILLVGSGADEQCAGYGRHKTKYRHGSWLVLHEEMKLDMQRIWKRNLGRDDRCIADNGKEARFPFLDEDVIRVLLDIPLWEIADLDQPSGIGDKKILREVAKLLGIIEAAILPKRAIQFGSRIARESNRKNFGSNRAANQASAGSAVIYRPPS
ncbi:uncharacterized protein LOC132302766 isoform X2 [Cornus florida]|uniref:uncharacterized protein LOC132302766 isoform X2 n=1 Tax=Cornus florida TaxID=4283 RepID=UPI00289F19CD|nr:uncharacterized protein LOC132302766 isoform X2 [Cornus florida]